MTHAIVVWGWREGAEDEIAGQGERKKARMNSNKHESELIHMTKLEWALIGMNIIDMV